MPFLLNFNRGKIVKILREYPNIRNDYTFSPEWYWGVLVRVNAFNLSYLDMNFIVYRYLTKLPYHTIFIFSRPIKVNDNYFIFLQLELIGKTVFAVITFRYWIFYFLGYAIDLLNLLLQLIRSFFQLWIGLKLKNRSAWLHNFEFR